MRVGGAKIKRGRIFPCILLINYAVMENFIHSLHLLLTFSFLLLPRSVYRMMTAVFGGSLTPTTKTSPRTPRRRREHERKLTHNPKERLRDDNIESCDAVTDRVSSSEKWNNFSVISEVNNTWRNILSAMTCVCVCEGGWGVFFLV